MTVIAKSRPRSSFKSDVSGVALLQVLLLGAIISLLAMRFTQTARDQIEISQQLDSRLRAQLSAYSVMNEVIFTQLSGTFLQQTPPSNLSFNNLDAMRINVFGQPVNWSLNAVVTMQDLSGLLPHRYPEHPFWKRILQRSSVSASAIEQYQGGWKDFQDPDEKRWIVGGKESGQLPSGQSYTNLPAQNDKIFNWIFSDDLKLRDRLAVISSVNAPYETNLLASPRVLLEALFDPLIAQEIAILRDNLGASGGHVALRNLLPMEVDRASLARNESNLKRIKVSVSNEFARWEETRLIRFESGSSEPFVILLIN
ncbi:hypothetical protein N9R09_00970 [Porticoccaceae bacterium]|nr:hypothetical protein [Porticoccaceae bacterium]